MTQKHATKHGFFKSVVQAFDIYGAGVALTFRKKAKYTTGVGMVSTLLTLTIMIAFLTNRLMKLVSKDDPFFSMLNFASDQKEDIDLWENKYMFAVE